MTHVSNLIDLHTGLRHSGLTAHEQAGFELGWDHAHHGLVPAAPYAEEASPVRDGLLAAQATFGTRTLAATRHVRKWLQLRLHAWLRGRGVELVQVTPNYLQQIEASHCPITRVPFAGSGFETSDASVDRVRDDAGYAAGNLAMMSIKANHAKAAFGFIEASGCAQRIDAGESARIDGLDSAQWWRVATLCSYVRAMPHADACEIPMRVLPPNRLRLFNPVQALQAFVSRQFLKPGWSQRVARFEDLLPTPGLRRDFKSFFMTLTARVIESGASGDKRGVAATRWAVEDAWCVPLVLQRWTRFARQLTPLQCETLLERAASGGLATSVVMSLPPHGATEGWNVETRGYVPHLAPFGAARQDRAQRHLAW